MGERSGHGQPEPIPPWHNEQRQNGHGCPFCNSLLRDTISIMSNERNIKNKVSEAGILIIFPAKPLT
jgi:hypothetical protein